MSKPIQNENPHHIEREFALDVVKKLVEKGHTALFAGGCVRDELLGLVPADYDVASSASPDEVRKIFRRSLPVGVAFGVVDVLGPKVTGRTIHVQVATFRSDGAYIDGRHPEAVHFGSAEQDAQRRDFTINGIFSDPINDQIIDFVGGRKDLDRRLLRAIGNASDRFREDRLRLLRAARLAARFVLEVDPETEEAIRNNAAGITLVSPERIADELRRMLGHATRARALSLLCQWELFQPILPSITPPCEETIEIINRLPPKAGFISVLALLLPHVQDAKRIGLELRLSNTEVRDIAWLVSQKGWIAKAHTLPNHQLFPILEHSLFKTLLEINRAQLGNGSESEGLNRCQSILKNPPLGGFSPPPFVNGSQLIQNGLKPGPAFTRVLEEVRNAQLDGLLTHQEEALKMAVTIYHSLI